MNLNKTAIIVEHPMNFSRSDMEKVLAEILENSNINVVPANSSESRDLCNALHPRKIAIWWCAGDIDDRARERGIILTEGQIMNILAAVKSQHTSEAGINWDVVDTHTDMELTKHEDQ